MVPGSSQSISISKRLSCAQRSNAFNISLPGRSAGQIPSTNLLIIEQTQSLIPHPDPLEASGVDFDARRLPELAIDREPYCFLEIKSEIA